MRPAASDHQEKIGGMTFLALDPRSRGINNYLPSGGGLHTGHGI
jgi:hypothetical protein